MTAYQNFIDGRHVPAASGATLDVAEPATGQVWASIPRSGAADIDDALRAAGNAYAIWSALDAKARAGYLRAIAEESGFGKDSGWESVLENTKIKTAWIDLS